VDHVKKAIRRDLPFTTAVSGGNTPKLFFSVLGDRFSGAVSWSNVHFFWVDERCVPPGDDESNFGMTHEALLSKIQIPGANIHRIRGEDDPEPESARYENELKQFFARKNGTPYINMMFLGLGEDGHTASIFPGNENLFKSERLCVPSIHPVTRQKRITLTGNVINSSEKIIFLVTGETTAYVIKDILQSEISEKHFPASFVEPVEGSVFWYIDKEAGSLLDPDFTNK
jgi:6-phosphogluconolactonase